jgi:hypothetical protein
VGASYAIGRNVGRQERQLECPPAERTIAEATLERARQQRQRRERRIRGCELAPGGRPGASGVADALESASGGAGAANKDLATPALGGQGAGLPRGRVGFPCARPGSLVVSHRCEVKLRQTEVVMGFDQYHEPAGELSPQTRTFARMCASLTEEAEAIGWYEQRMSVETDPQAKAIMADAQKEEFKHFSMDLEFLLRQAPAWRAIARGVLFKDGDIVEHGDDAEESAD